jgi:Glycosyl hydrolase family 26
MPRRPRTPIPGLLALVALVVVLLAAPSTGAAAGRGRLYWGALVGPQFTGAGAPGNWPAVRAFERVDAGGKRMSVLHFGGQWYSSGACGGYCGFPAGEASRIHGAGMIPFYSWGSTGEGPGFTDAQIAGGAQDAYITAWAQAAKAWGHPLFLRFDWEMNGGWFPYGVGAGANSTADYVAMWRHVHDIFARVGARNVSWVWCPEIGPGDTVPLLPSLYPGEKYVGWTCLDGYNTGRPWLSFRSILTPEYRIITRSIAPRKPMIIGEIGTTETGGSKAQWIAGMLADLPVRFPKVRGVLWYDSGGVGPGGQSDWPIETSPGAAAAFAAGIARSAYLGATFRSLGFRPVPVP